MRIYKVTFEKIVFVRANNKTEAEERALDDDYIVCDEGVREVKLSNRTEIGQTLFNIGCRLE